MSHQPDGLFLSALDISVIKQLQRHDCVCVDDQCVKDVIKGVIYNDRETAECFEKLIKIGLWVSDD